MNPVYGPVSSWRLGRSLGIDLICQEPKVCSFDCVYCQLGKTDRKTNIREQFIDTERVKDELNRVLSVAEIDFLTFSGTGEPTLAGNLAEIVNYIKKTYSVKTAILTNSSLLEDNDVLEALYAIDFVVVKLDACNQALFKKINRPLKGLLFEEIVDNIKRFKYNYHGKLALQIMFIDDNEPFIKKFVEIAHEIDPDEIQINTPLRPCDVMPLSEERIAAISHEFRGFKNVISVYSSHKPDVSPIDLEEVRKRKRPTP